MSNDLEATLRAVRAVKAMHPAGSLTSQQALNIARVDRDFNSNLMTYTDRVAKQADKPVTPDAVLLGINAVNNWSELFNTLEGLDIYDQGYQVQFQDGYSDLRTFADLATDAKQITFPLFWPQSADDERPSYLVALTLDRAADMTFASLSRAAKSVLRNEAITRITEDTALYDGEDKQAYLNQLFPLINRMSLNVSETSASEVREFLCDHFRRLLLNPSDLIQRQASELRTKELGSILAVAQLYADKIGAKSYAQLESQARADLKGSQDRIRGYEEHSFQEAIDSERPRLAKHETILHAIVSERAKLIKYLGE